MNTLRPVCRVGGFTLVELMIAMLLGLIVVAVVLGFFPGMLQGYRTNNAVSDVQTNSRLAFELLTYDVRNAGLTGCSNEGRVTNILRNSPANGGADWNADWDNALRGYRKGGVVDDPALSTVTPGQVANTDSIQVINAAGTAMSVKLHTLAAGQFDINGSAGNLKDGDIVIVCDPDHAAILQIATVGSSALVYKDAPNNCGASLDFPGSCAASGTYAFGPNSQIAPLNAVDWYIGNNAEGGQSLYRLAPLIADEPQEMVRDVTGMTFSYLPLGTNTFVDADAVTDWSAVTAVQIKLTVQSAAKRAGTNAQPLKRDYTTTVALYNRVN